ncbi:hypothetical protein BDZ94DRAFT_1256453, partial [Collybia nuda]
MAIIHNTKSSRYHKRIIGSVNWMAGRGTRPVRTGFECVTKRVTRQGFPNLADRSLTVFNYLMLPYSPNAFLASSLDKRKGRPLNRRISNLSYFPRNARYTRVIPAILGLGVLVGASVYLLYPDPSRSAPTSTKKALSASHFTPTIVTSNESCGPDSRLLELTIPLHLLPSLSPSNSRFTPIWSVFVKDDEIQVERPYTPLEGVDEHGRMLFWIKKYPKGEVGRWLHSKDLGEQVELRGPLTTWPWKDDPWDEVVMISGGTGITPFYQLLYSLFSSQVNYAHNTHFTLLHSSRSPADLPPLRILDTLSIFASQHPDKFALHLFVDSIGGQDERKPGPMVRIGRIGKSAIEQSLGLRSKGSWWDKILSKYVATVAPPKKTLFLVCGPDSMINAISGPYGRNFSQGSVGGVLGEMGFTSKEVWKM